MRLIEQHTPTGFWLNDVPFRAVILGAKQYSSVAITHTVWTPLLGLSLDSVECALNNSQQW
jgi:hypothetical protein